MTKKFTVEEKDDQIILRLTGKPVQKGSRHMQCDMYAENYLRHRYGKFSTDPGRDIEKRHSQVSKEIALFDRFNLAISSWGTESDDPEDFLSTLAIIKATTSKDLDLKPADSNHLSFFVDEINVILKNFPASARISRQEVLEFVEQRTIQKKIAIMKKIMDAAELKNIDNRIAKGIPELKAVSLTWIDKRRREYGLSIPAWCPQNGLSHLMKNLKVAGPLVAQGYYGPHLYNQDPIKLSYTLLGSDVYGFVKGSKKPIAELIKTGDYFSHCIVLVGGVIHKEAIKNLVYYIDPNYPAKNGVPDRFFVISFKSLVESIFPLGGSFTLDMANSPARCLLAGPPSRGSTMKITASSVVKDELNKMLSAKEKDHRYQFELKRLKLALLQVQLVNSPKQHQDIIKKNILGLLELMKKDWQQFFKVSEKEYKFNINCSSWILQIGGNPNFLNLVTATFVDAGKDFFRQNIKEVGSALFFQPKPDGRNNTGTKKSAEEMKEGAAIQCAMQ